MAATATCVPSDEAAYTGVMKAVSKDCPEPLLEQISKIKIGKSHRTPDHAAPKPSNRNNESSVYQVFDSVPFTPSQGVKSPSPHHPQAYGWYICSPFNMMKQVPHSSPNTVLLDGSSDASNSSPMQPLHYAIYPCATPYSPRSGSVNDQPPSPLMGTPVATPTAMMFPQTPFAGAPGQPVQYSPSFHYASRNPFRPDSTCMPGSPHDGKYFHPFFSSFQPNVAVACQPPPPPPPPPPPHEKKVAPVPAAAKTTAAFVTEDVAPKVASAPAPPPAPALKLDDILLKDVLPVLSGSGQSSKCSTGRNTPVLLEGRENLVASKAASFTSTVSNSVASTSAATSTTAFSRPDSKFSLESMVSSSALHDLNMASLPALYNLQSVMAAPQAPNLSIYDMTEMLAAASWSQNSMACLPTPGIGLCPTPLIGAWPMAFPAMIPQDAASCLNPGYLHPNLAGMQGGLSGLPGQTAQRGMMNRNNYRPHRPRRGTQDLRYGPDGMPRLNARQRRTLRRARERAINGLIEAGRVLLQKEGMIDEPIKERKTDNDADSDDGTSHEDTARYMDAALSVASGSAGPKAAADAAQVLNKVAAELDDGDLGSLISQLSNKNHDGVIDDSLIRDLQIIQNLISSLKPHA